MCVKDFNSKRHCKYTVYDIYDIRGIYSIEYVIETFDFKSTFDRNQVYVWRRSRMHLASCLTL